MPIIKAILIVFANFIIYYAFGSFLIRKKDAFKSIILTIAVGFFTYYSLFAVCTLPIMLTYRPLSLLTGIWTPFVGVVVVLAAVFNRKVITEQLKDAAMLIKEHPIATAVIALIILIQVITVVCSYNFTLDAAYYVANVTTSVDTDMINVYDPFTGAWQDHYELRYAFATYSINDAVVCQLTGIPALVQTKTVMAACVVILVNLVYLGIAKTFFADDSRRVTIMMLIVMWINYTFITIYTSSNFLITRTYEGKAIVGNISLVLIFWMYVLLVKNESISWFWLMIFAVCFGSTSITSSANMLIPAELSVLFVPYIIKHKDYKIIPKYIIAMVPAIVMLMMYVLYVKGYFAIYTYPR